MINFKKFNTLSPFDWSLILIIISLSIIYSILEGNLDIIGSVAVISGVSCVVLVAKGNILNYIFGIVNVALYAYISYKAKLYGDAALNAVYYFPMQFIGWFMWLKRRRDKESATIVSKQMGRKERFYLFSISLILVIFCGYILGLIGDPQPYKDSAKTVLSVIAMYLMVKTYTEQWILWIVVNIISVLMWIIAYLRGDAHSMLMVIMWLAYLANSINGWIIWVKLSKSQPENLR